MTLVGDWRGDGVTVIEGIKADKSGTAKDFLLVGS